MIGRCSRRISHFPVGRCGVSHSDVTSWDIQVPDSLLHGVRAVERRRELLDAGMGPSRVRGSIQARSQPPRMLPRDSLLRLIYKQLPCIFSSNRIDC